MNAMRRDVAVVGAGLAGFSTAVGLAAAGIDTVLVGPIAADDRRSTALIGGSVEFLTEVGAFEAMQASAAPLAAMRIIDDTQRLLRAPTVEFRARELGLDVFGYNVLNRNILAALQARAEMLAAHLTLVEAAVSRISTDTDAVTLSLADGRVVEACLVVGADGRRSVVRSSAGIALQDWSYPQTAIVLNFAHAREHEGISTEFHTRSGPFTQVPLEGRRSSLVWVEEPTTAALLADLAPEKLAARIEAKMHSILGAVTVDGLLQTFPLSGARADRLTAPRTMLVGEAAHVFPPIGAQGLNLGLRDAAAVVASVSAHRDDPGGREPLARYAADRRIDVASRTFGVDMLNRSLLTGLLPVQAGRAIGLSAMGRIGPLRRFVMREGIGPGKGLAGLQQSLRDRIDRRRSL